ncbi:MAG: hypothetical protein OEV85_14280 [Candidatus Thorarchaeota archaeon]|nr:hypothetical protein [Candidatus Thorarchaeota archaeon]
MLQNLADLSSEISVVIIIIIILVCIGFLFNVGEEVPKRTSEEMELLPYVRKEIEMTATPVEYWRGYARQGVIHQKKPIPGVARSLEAIQTSPKTQTQAVRAMRGGEFIGNRMRFKVKVFNESPYTITDVRIFLISYPSEALRLVSKDDDAYYSKIEPNGFRSPSFDFLPTQDCVKGEICGGVSFVDMKGQPHTLTTKPFVIRSVCDLLLPDQIEPKEFELKLKKLECGEVAVKVTDWTPEEMHEKALRIVEDANFYEVSSNIETDNGIVHAKISGLAKGKYTGKSVAVELLISGRSSKKGASCKIRISGEDQAMILPAIDDLKERLSAWLCPMCSSPLTLANVEDLRSGKVITCPFCSVSIGR